MGVVRSQGGGSDPAERAGGGDATDPGAVGQSRLGLIPPFSTGGLTVTIYKQ